jgi:large subunit ribosomal protein L21
VKKINQTSEKTTLGDKDALTELRAQFEKAEGAPAKAAKAKADAEAAAAAETSNSSEGIAELKDLSGVGPAMVKRMNALGINSIEELLAITDEKAAELSEQDAKISVDQWNKWITEAKG